MDHKALVASLTTAERLALTERSDQRGLAHLCGHLGAIALTGALIFARVPFWPVVMIPHGILLVFLFTLLHETSHRTPFRTGWINTAVGHLCGFVLFLPAGWFRHFHFAHHRFTQIPGKDPELATPKPATWPQYLLHVSGLPTWRGHFAALFGNAAGRCDADYVPAARRPELARDARIMLALYAGLFAISLAVPSAALVWVWLVPLLIGQPFLRLYLLAEHGRCAFVANMLENSRTTTTSKLIRFLAWNMPYHAEHHSYPAVPFHRLPDLHRLAAPHLREAEAGYTAFNRRYAAGLARGF